MRVRPHRGRRISPHKDMATSTDSTESAAQTKVGLYFLFASSQESTSATNSLRIEFFLASYTYRMARITGVRSVGAGFGRLLKRVISDHG